MDIRAEKIKELQEYVDPVDVYELNQAISNGTDITKYVMVPCPPFKARTVMWMCDEGGNMLNFIPILDTKTLNMEKVFEELGGFVLGDA